MKRFIAIIMAAIMLCTLLPVASIADGAKWTEVKMPDGWIKVLNEGGATLGYSPESGVTLLEQDGFAFKDLNKNGKLDVYEDWRVDDKERAASLADMLTIEEILPLLVCTSGAFSSADKTYPDELTDAVKALLETGQRSIGGSQLIEKDGAPEKSVNFNNLWQAYAESLGYGIPISMCADPIYGTVTDNKKLLGFPAGTLALAATFDPDFAGEVSAAMGKLYRATGMTTILGPEVDLASEPRWSRIQTTFGEDPALTRDMANAVTGAYQSTYDEEGNDLGWGEDSLNTTVKHFPGDGMGEGGRESHKDYGKFAVYPGDNFEAHLIPYFDGAFDLDSLTGVASGIMTSFSIAYDENEKYGELVGTGFSEYKVNILRENGYDEMIMTDASIASVKPWGVENLTEEERNYKAFKAGVDQLLMSYNKDMMDSVWDLAVADMGEEKALERFRDSARRVLTTYFYVELFENPYLSLEKTEQLFNDESLKALSVEAAQKGVVMLKNTDNTIKPFAENAEKPTVYIPMTYYYTTRRSDGYGWKLPVDLEKAEQYFNVVTDTVGEPTGVDANGNTIYSDKDVIRASAEELANCDFAIAIVREPTVATYTNGGFVSGTYVPISLQYGEYVADSDVVRKVSIAGDMILETSAEPETADEALAAADPYAADPYAADPYAYEEVVGAGNDSQGNYVKENRSYYGQAAEVAPNVTDLDAILYARENIPAEAKLIVCVGCKGPMVLGEFEDKADAILVNFDWGAFDYNFDHNNYLDIIVGKVEPSGLLPVQMPKDMIAVESQQEDVPRDMECYVDANGNTYDFAFGLNWSGIISDARTAKYNVAPLTNVAADIILK